MIDFFEQVAAVRREGHSFAIAMVAVVNGITYYFCCASCRAKSLKDPQTYLGDP